MRGRVLRVAACVLAAMSVSAYVAAKVHFFTAFDPANLGEYWADHWIYSTVLALTLAMLWGVAALMRRSR